MSAWDDPVAHIRGLEADRDVLMRATWSAYVETGADTDGDDKWHCSPEWAGKALMHAVATLRKDYDDSLDESTALEAEVERLRGVDFGSVLARHLPRDRCNDEGESLGTYCTCGDWTGDYFAAGEFGPFDAHLADALRAALEGR